jgi:hypothetical protein
MGSQSFGAERIILNTNPSFQKLAGGKYYSNHIYNQPSIIKMHEIRLQ